MHHATLQQASPSSGRDHDVTDAKYRGRHRARRRSAVSPRIVGTGLVLPTTATLAIVSVALAKLFSCEPSARGARNIGFSGKSMTWVEAIGQTNSGLGFLIFAR